MAKKKTAAKTTVKTAAKKKPARKKAAAPLTLSPIVAPGTPKNYRARVRMYRHGLGDCFLLSFPRKNQKPYQILIDCGVLNQGADVMTTFVEHLRDTVKDGGPGKARIDAVVCTHEHKDHLSGFNQARDVFNDDIEFGSVWLGWTENLTKPEINKIKKARRSAARQLQAAISDPKITALALDGIKDAAAVLRFSSDDDKVGSSKIAEALEYLKQRGKQAGDLRYLEPGQEPFELDEVDGVRVYVLGPPRDPILLKGSEVTERLKEEGVIYHLSRRGETAVETVAVAVAAASGAGADDADRFHPFAAEHRIPATQPSWHANAGQPNPHYQALRGFLAGTYDDPKQQWRRIDHDWLNAFGQLALDLDSDTNNTSLVLAFEFVRTREVLLFVGDAQVGNWLSWANVNFKVPGRDKPLPAHDLLSRAVFYKVGHHCSHNATLKKGGLELMTRDDLVGFIPLDIATAHNQGTKGWDMPAGPLHKALKERTADRLVISDVNEQPPQAALDAGVLVTEMYVDYFLK
jgi:hypothetical protein